MDAGQSHIATTGSPPASKHAGHSALDESVTLSGSSVLPAGESDSGSNQPRPLMAAEVEADTTRKTTGAESSVAHQPLYSPAGLESLMLPPSRSPLQLFLAPDDFYTDSFGATNAFDYNHAMGVNTSASTYMLANTGLGIAGEQSYPSAVRPRACSSPEVIKMVASQPNVLIYIGSGSDAESTPPGSTSSSSSSSSSLLRFKVQIERERRERVEYQMQSILNEWSKEQEVRREHGRRLAWARAVLLAHPVEAARLQLWVASHARNPSGAEVGSG